MCAPRRSRLVSKGGVEMFEVRIVQYFDAAADQYTRFEITTAEGTPEPVLHEILGVIEVAKRAIITWYETPDEEN